MNKIECKKYIKRAYERLKFQNKEINPKNMEIEMKNVISNESQIYIAYAKIAVYNLNNSASEITSKLLVDEIDVIPKIMSKTDIIIKSKSL